MELDPLISLARTSLTGLSARLSAPEAATLADFVHHAQDIGPFEHYKIFPQKARALIPSHLLADGSKASAVFLKAAILHGMLETMASGRFTQLPQRVRAQQTRQFERMLAQGEALPEWLDVDHDLFHKEFGIATLRLYVTGAQLIDPRCGIPRSILFKGGAGRVPGNLAKLLRLGGFRAYFQIHTHKFMLDTFNEEGWNECYRCCAELYALHPEVRGMYGSSWFYDPALDVVSPRLSYLRAIPLAGGAELFFVEEGGDALNNSLSTSPTRRKLYEEKKYSPKSYMLAWGRVKQIAWAQAQSRLAS